MTPPEWFPEWFPSGSQTPREAPADEWFPGSPSPTGEPLDRRLSRPVPPLVPQHQNHTQIRHTTRSPQ